MPFPNFKNDMFFPADFSSALSTLQATSGLSSLSSLLGPKVNSTLCLCTELTQHTACLIKCPVTTRLPTRSTVHPVVCPLVVSPKLLTGESFASDSRVRSRARCYLLLHYSGVSAHGAGVRYGYEVCLVKYQTPPPHTHTHIIACLVNYMWLVSVDWVGCGQAVTITSTFHVRT